MFSKAVFRDLFFQVHFTDMDFQKTNICIESNNMGACEAVLLGVFFLGGGEQITVGKSYPSPQNFPFQNSLSAQDFRYDFSYLLKPTQLLSTPFLEYLAFIRLFFCGLFIFSVYGRVF